MPLLREFEVSSPFGMRWHPVYQKYKLHEGIDIPCYYESIYAYGAGVVTTVSNHTSAGIYIVTDHGVYETWYLHLSRALVRKGQKVDRQQLIGTSGNTGTSTGPHLHFGIRIKKNKKWVDPMLFDPYDKLTTEIDGVEYETILNKEENKTYIELRKLLENLGHTVTWENGVKVILNDKMKQEIDDVIAELQKIRDNIG